MLGITENLDCPLECGSVLIRALKISGFSFIRNGNALGYPFEAAIRSLLPLCDEIIVNVPRSTDGTLKSVRAIAEPKIRIIESEWDEKERVGDPILRRHTDLALEQCTGDWCVYIQGDEVLHESGIPAMKRAMEKELGNAAVQGLLVDYTHFYGSFWTYAYAFGWYQREVRVIRRTSEIRAWGGAQGFRTTSGQKLRVKRSGGHYFHYGHALRPEVARIKCSSLASLYNAPDVVQQFLSRPERFYEEDQKVKPFTGTHPVVMQKTVAAADWTYSSRNPLVRFRRKYFWKDMALLLKNCTGITLGVHKNYRLID